MIDKAGGLLASAAASAWTHLKYICPTSRMSVSNKKFALSQGMSASQSMKSLHHKTSSNSRLQQADKETREKCLRMPLISMPFRETLDRDSIFLKKKSDDSDKIHI